MPARTPTVKGRGGGRSGRVLSRLKIMAISRRCRRVAQHRFLFLKTSHTRSTVRYSGHSAFACGNSLRKNVRLKAPRITRVAFFVPTVDHKDGSLREKGNPLQRARGGPASGHESACSAGTPPSHRRVITEPRGNVPLAKRSFLDPRFANQQKRFPRNFCGNSSR